MKTICHRTNRPSGTRSKYDRTWSVSRRRAGREGGEAGAGSDTADLSAAARGPARGAGPRAAKASFGFVVERFLDLLLLEAHQRPGAEAGARDGQRRAF